MHLVINYYIYFLSNDNYKASIHVDDFECFAVLENLSIDEILPTLKGSVNNQKICEQYSEEISEILEGEDWIAL